MAEVNLFPSDTQPLPRLAWQIIDAARRQCLTGELALDSNPPSRVYLRDGFVYYAERTTDASPGVRLLIEGVITRDQRAKGAVQVNGAEHLGRMFERDSTIDRASAEVCIE